MATTPAEVIGLCGNHDDWMLKTRRDFRRHTWVLATDAFTTSHSYSPDAAQGIDTISHGVLTAVRMPGGDIFQSARHRRRNQVPKRRAD